MADPTALARGGIQTLKGESLPGGGPPWPPCRHQGASSPQGPSRMAEQSPRQPLLPAVGKSHMRALSRPSKAELQGRTRAPGGSVDSKM